MSLPVKLPVESIPGVEIFVEGQHGSDRYTRDDLNGMVDAFDKLGFHPILKADTSDKRVFGAPALGYVDRIYTAGGKLYADLRDLPKKVAEIIRRRDFRKLATEIYWNYKDEAGGKTYPRALKGLTLVGANLGKLDSIAEIEKLFARDYGSTAQAFKSYEYDGGKIMEPKDEKNLTIASRDLAQKALEYAQANDVDFPTAIKTLMRESRHYEQDPRQTRWPRSF